MPKRTDIEKILIIGSGPIVIGQACEFDYSGTQAVKALREEGYTVVLVNSNPATIMTDPELADQTYVEPVTADTVAKVIAKEKPQALLPTLGGQTALNVAVELAKMGVLEEHGVELIGANLEAIQKAEDRQRFKDAMVDIGLDVPKSAYCTSFDEAMKVSADIGFPAIIRPSFTLGGTGGSIAFNREEYSEYVLWGLNASPEHTILVEESVLGWKEFELEVMRDHADNVVIICSIENVDPMGVHTGDSMTVAPAQTLTDREYQRMRDAAIRIMREIGVDTGGSNVQFGVDPKTGRQVVIEMNPRVSRSSALASKATGFPIAKIAAKLAVGYTLDEIRNDITRETPASFEPAIDYVVTKVPRFAFEKFEQADNSLTTQMKSVGEVMAIGRNFAESVHKALRSLEISRFGLEEKIPDSEWRVRRAAGLTDAPPRLEDRLRIPTPGRPWYIAEAFRGGLSIIQVQQLTGIDPWFLEHFRRLVVFEREIGATRGDDEALRALLRQAKRAGFADRRIADLSGRTEAEVRAMREDAGIFPVFKTVDTCAAEFEAFTPYHYSSYDEEDEVRDSDERKVMILGSGPNRIGQGVEFDYCCVHASYALAEQGFETIMLNCNPETVSTDYDTSDRLYFEPLTAEDVIAVCRREKPEGVIVQFGGQTPLKLAHDLEAAGIKILGTPPDAIDLAEDRERFRSLLDELGLKQPPSGIARSVEQAMDIATDIGFPVLVRPSYVLGGRGMEVVYGPAELREYVEEAILIGEEKPVLIDRFLEDAIEVDVDAIGDGEQILIGGIMEHIQQAGIHSGDSACALPPYSLPHGVREKIREQARALGNALGVRGLMNVQLAVKDQDIYVIEVNPRASRTVPFVSKATGIPLAKIAAKVMVGSTLADLGVTEEVIPEHVSVKEAVFPWSKFQGVDPVLGPEMRSTGEVMGVDADFGRAFAKSQMAAGMQLPQEGTAFVSVRDHDKPHLQEMAAKLVEMGFSLVGTAGTVDYLKEHDVPCELIMKVSEGRPNIVDAIINGEIAVIINTPSGAKAATDSSKMRRAAVQYGVPYYTTLAAAAAAVQGIEALRSGELGVGSLQLHLRTRE